jgi:hypothetical protein
MNMEFTADYFVGIALAYIGAVGVWFVVTRARPSLWAPIQQIHFARPKIELGWALLAIAFVLVLTVLDNMRLLLPRQKGLVGHLVFLGVLFIVWLPVILVLLFRQQGLHTCLLSTRGVGKKILWGVGVGILGMALYLVARGKFHAFLQLPSAFLSTRHLVVLIQSIMLMAGVGFLLVRIIAVAGKWVGIIIVGALYGLAKYPLYMMQYRMGFLQATVMIVFSALIAMIIAYIIYDRQDVIVISIFHFFLDEVQAL